MIGSEQRGDVRVLSVKGTRIDAAGAVAFKEAVHAALADAGEGRVVMDLAAVEFVDSSGLGALVATAKALGAGRKLELSGSGPVVMKVLTLTRMDRIFMLHDDLDAALSERSAA